MTPCGPLLTAIFARATCAIAMVNNTSPLLPFPGDVTGVTDTAGVGGGGGNDDEVRGDGEVGSSVITTLVAGAVVCVILAPAGIDVMVVAICAVLVTVVVSLLCVPWTRHPVDRRLTPTKRRW